MADEEIEEEQEEETTSKSKKFPIIIVAVNFRSSYGIFIFLSLFSYYFFCLS